MKKSLLALLIFSFFKLAAQDGDLLLHSEIYHFIDRMDIKGATDTIMPTDLKPYPREQFSNFLARIDSTKLKKRDQLWLQRARFILDDQYCNNFQIKKKSKKSRDEEDDDRDTPKMGFNIFNYVYRNRRDLVSFHSKAVRIFANPLIYASAGLDNQNFNATSSKLTYVNTRGASLRGSFYNKLGFYASFTDNIRRLPYYANHLDSTANLQQSASPGASFLKISPDNVVGFLASKAYITFSPIKQLRFKMGRDRAFWGNGEQSMFLSDYAVDSWMFSANAKIWKFEYHYQLNQLIDYVPNKPDAYGAYPRKWATFHQIFFRPYKQVSFSFFESVIYSANSPQGSRGFELNYLNPLIFYRTVEQYIGSPDNGMMGISFKANILKHFQLYGQLAIDDYNVGNRKIGKGWWGNKTALQGGLKWIDMFGVSTLDLKFEYNNISPYTYSHSNPSANYTHYGQFLAHSMGANLNQLFGELQYQPLPGVYLTADFSILKKGLDQNGTNYGGNVFRSNGSHFQDYNNSTLQGKLLTITNAHGKLTYQFKRIEFYLDLEAYIRKENSISSTVLLGSLRIGVPYQSMRF